MSIYKLDDEKFVIVESTGDEKVDEARPSPRRAPAAPRTPRAPPENTVVGQLKMNGITKPADITALVNNIKNWGASQGLKWNEDAFTDHSEGAASSTIPETKELAEELNESKTVNPRQPSKIVRHPSLVPYRK